jgi:hypothetical protein
MLAKVASPRLLNMADRRYNTEYVVGRHARTCRIGHLRASEIS